MRVPLATARNSTCVQPTTGSYIVPNVPQTLVSVDLMANKLYYLYSTSFIYSTPINGTSNQTYTCVVDEGVPALLLTTFGTMVVVYSELYFFVDGSAAQPQFVPLIMQYMHANLQPFPCKLTGPCHGSCNHVRSPPPSPPTLGPPSPPTLFQVQSTSTTATVSWSPPRSSPTVLYPCAAGKVFPILSSVCVCVCLLCVCVCLLCVCVGVCVFVVCVCVFVVCVCVWVGGCLLCLCGCVWVFITHALAVYGVLHVSHMCREHTVHS